MYVRHRLVVERNSFKREQLKLATYVGLLAAATALSNCLGLTPTIPGPALPYAHHRCPSLPLMPACACLLR
jgi:hypothetical protein